MASNSTGKAQSMQGYSLSQFFTTLIVSGVIAGIEIILFVILRTIFKRIYAPKTFLGDEKHRVKPLPRTPYGWLPALLMKPTEDLIRTSGLDAYFFARYLYIHAFFFLGSFVLLAIILFPIYVVDGKGATFGKTGLDILTFGNISPRNSSRYVAPLVLAYVFIGTYLCILYIEMKIFVKKRQTLLRSAAYQSRASATTILVLAIPKEYMSNDALLRIFDQFPGGVKHIWLNRSLKDLPKKAEQRMKLINKLETIECKLIRTALKNEAKRQEKNFVDDQTMNSEENVMNRYIPQNKRPSTRVGPIPILSSLCFGKKVDSITHCKTTIAKLNEEIDSAKANLNDYAPMNSAFIQFNKQIAAHMAVQSVASSIPLTMSPRYIDVKPGNIVWSNLRLTYYEEKVRKLMVLAATGALIVFWAIPVTFIGILSNLTYLVEKVTFLNFIYQLPDVLVGFITGLLPSIFLAFLMTLLAIVLKFLAKFSGIPTTDAIDRYVQGSFFVFQVTHVFLFVTISSSISSVIADIAQNPTKAATILAANIPTASNFFFSYMALQGLSMACSNLLQISTLVTFYLYGKLFDNTPRKKWKRYNTLTSLGWGTIFPVFTNFVVITLVYSIITPLMLLISAIAFGLFYTAYAYNMFYVKDFPSDTGGLAYPRALYQSLTGVYLMEILLAALFFLVQNDNGHQVGIPHGALMCVLIAITIAVHKTMRSSFNPLTYNLPFDIEEYTRIKTHGLETFPLTKTAVKMLNHGRSIDNDESIKAINNALMDSYDNTMDNAYLHPALRDPMSIIWIPRDSLGIAVDEVQRTRDTYTNVPMSTEGARFNEKMKIEVHSPPPDHVEIIDENIDHIENADDHTIHARVSNVGLIV